MEIKYALLTKKDIPFMQLHIEQDGEFCAEKLARFIDAPNTYGFAAKQGNAILGFAYCYKLTHPYVGTDSFFLYSIGIFPEYQNKGLGTGFVECIKRFAFEELKCGEVFVMTDKGNKRACRVYEKCGGKNDYEDEICYVIYNNGIPKQQKPACYYGVEE